MQGGFVQQQPPCRLADRQHDWNALRAAAMSLTFASVMAAGLSAAAAGSGPEQFRSVRHDPSRFVAASDDFSSAKRPARQRLRIEVRRQFWTDELGTVYGYPPGNYILGPYGILYGPYPIRRSRSVVDLGY
jgi:hypothetical protein